MTVSVYRSICIAVATRGRPKMLASLLASLAVMTLPERALIRFLVVENNSHATLQDVIATFKQQMSLNRVDYVLEQEIVISSARNRALDYCLDEEMDFLVFVDDDEVVDKEWLQKLLIVGDRGRFDLVGSPVRPKPYMSDLTVIQQIVWKGVEHNARRIELKLRRKCDAGQSATIKIATGS